MYLVTSVKKIDMQGSFYNLHIESWNQTEY